MARKKTLKLATFNVNGVGTRLPHLLAWLAKEQPDVVALQELKAVDAAFPAAALEEAGYLAIWHGQHRWNGVALLGRGVAPQESRRGLPGDPGDEQSRYIEAAVHGIVVGALYLPNGNPVGTAKFTYKLDWMARLNTHARALLAFEEPLALCGDYNVIPEPQDAKNPEAWIGELLAGRDRTVAGPTAPSNGLVFVGPRYPREWGLPDEVCL